MRLVRRVVKVIIGLRCPPVRKLVLICMATQLEDFPDDGAVPYINRVIVIALRAPAYAGKKGERKLIAVTPIMAVIYVNANVPMNSTNWFQ
jgi:hypothetical protein